MVDSGFKLKLAPSLDSKTSPSTTGAEFLVIDIDLWLFEVGKEEGRSLLAESIDVRDSEAWRPFDDEEDTDLRISSPAKGRLR